MAGTELVHAGINVVVEILALELRQILQDNKKKRRKHKIWVRKWISRRKALGASDNLISELADEDHGAYFNHLRMSEDQFNYLLNRIGDQIQKTNTHMRDAIPASLKLQVVLRYLATGESFTSLQYIYRIPKCSISKFLCEVMDAIIEALKEHLKVKKNQN